MPPLRVRASSNRPKAPVVVHAMVGSKPTPLDITAELKRTCDSLLSAVSETMHDLLSRVDPDYQAKVRQNVILAGGGSQIPGFAAALEKTLNDVGGGRVKTVDDPVFAGSNGGLAIALDAPEGDWEQLPG